MGINFLLGRDCPEFLFGKIPATTIEKDRSIEKGSSSDRSRPANLIGDLVRIVITARRGKMIGFQDQMIYSTSERKLQKFVIDRVSGQYSRRIRRALAGLGRRKWPPVFLLGIIPFTQFRLRSAALPFARIWWIEHDIPPYDRFLCAAYQVELTMDEHGLPILGIRNGAGVQSLAYSDWAAFESNLARSVDGPPLIIHRQFGRAEE